MSLLTVQRWDYLYFWKMDNGCHSMDNFSQCIGSKSLERQESDLVQ